MILKLIGQPKKVSTDRVKRAIELYSSKLMSKRLSKSVTIVVKFLDSLDDPDFIASCCWIDSPNRPREFLIEIKSDLGVNKTMTCLAHEMVHVKQFARGELKDYVRSSRVSYRGQVYDLSDEDSYWFTPWEIEAYGMEKGLYVSLKNYEKTLKK